MDSRPLYKISIIWMFLEIAYFYFAVGAVINIKLSIGRVMALSYFTNVLKMVLSNGPELKKKYEISHNKNLGGF
ncbi:Uncharacterised protein [Mycobacteroides abscessus subsp. abscessus]|nr:Uncharacterised protein [Mycobacteroides abscessus subsp. abscessus]